MSDQIIHTSRTDNQKAYRLIHSKFPPIFLFDDVSSPDDFEAVFAIQSLTNPRLQNEVGNLNLLPVSDIPFGIPGCSYAVAPFTHVNPAGSRFSDGSYGVLYCSDTIQTAQREIHHHMTQEWSVIEGLEYDRAVFRGLRAYFSADPVADIRHWPGDHQVYDPNAYGASARLGGELREHGHDGVQYNSVRAPGGVCWGLFTPRGVTQIQQTLHYEFIWDGARIGSVNVVRRADA